MLWKGESKVLHCRRKEGRPIVRKTIENDSEVVDRLEYATLIGASTDLDLWRKFLICIAFKAGNTNSIKDRRCRLGRTL